VPDSAAKVVVEDGQVTWGDAPLVINPWDEYAVEAALAQTEAYGGDVTAISIGGENAKDALKHALAMGCSQAILISDPALSNADSQVTSKVLATAIQKVEGVDLAFMGRQAIDSDTGLTASQTARILGWPALTLVVAIPEVNADTHKIRVERSMEEGRQIVEGNLPAVITVVKDYGEPRYPSFMGIRKASRADIPIWSLSDLGIDQVTPVVSWPELMNPPSRDVTTEIISADSPEEIADLLADKILAEKVL